MYVCIHIYIPAKAPFGLVIASAGGGALFDAALAQVK